MNDDNFAFRVLDCTELVLAGKGDNEKKLAVLMELERMVDYARPSVADGISEEQVRAYKSREEAARKRIIDWAHTLTLEDQAAAKEQLLNRNASYFNGAVMLGIAGPMPPGAGQVSGPTPVANKGFLGKLFK